MQRKESSMADRRQRQLEDKTIELGFFDWLSYYYDLACSSRHAVPPFLWALGQVISNRFTYGDWAPGMVDRDG
jgi:hypothetical protein